MGKFSIPKPGVERAFYSFDLETIVTAQPIIANDERVIEIRVVSSKGNPYRCKQLFQLLAAHFIGKSSDEWLNGIFNPEL